MKSIHGHKSRGVVETTSQRTNRASISGREENTGDFNLSKGGFKEYVVANRKLILTGGVVTAFLFLGVKLLYPYPDFFLDSYAYVADAAFNRKITYRPVGYAGFLKLLHLFSEGAGIVVLVQYLLFFLSTTFFFLSCDFLFGVSEKVRKILYFFMIINPLLLLQCNLISSDSLFCSASVLWLAACIWCIMRPSWLVLGLQVLLVFCCFHLRYTAMYYPIIAAVFFLGSKGKILFKLSGIAITALVIISTVEHRRDVMEEGSGVRIVTAFSGWQIANNVLCYYKEIKVDPDDLPSGNSREIDLFVRTGIDSLYYSIMNSVGTHFMWSKRSPLKRYLGARMKRYNTTYWYEWTVSSQYLNEYGWALIKSSPFAYVKYFMGRNLKNFFVPHREILENYDVNHEPMPAETKDWFGSTIDYLETKQPDFQKIVSFPYPWFICLINGVNILLLASMSYVCIRRRQKLSATSWRMLLVWGVYYFSFMFFCLFSTVVLLRYVDVLLVAGVMMPAVLWQRIQTVTNGDPVKDATEHALI